MTRRSPSRTRLSIWWIAVVVYVGLIFLISSRPRLTSPVTFPLWDKVAHLIEYALLALLAHCALGASHPRGGRALLRSGLLVLCGLLIATGDELYQATVPGRESGLMDFLADGVGLLVGAAVGHRVARRIAARHSERMHPSGGGEEP